MDRKKQGDLGVAAAIWHYTQMGYVVLVPLTDTARYDLVVDDGQRILRVQCKTSGYKVASGAYAVQLRTLGGNQSWSGEVRRLTEDECDLVFIYTLDGATWEFPSNVLHNRASVDLGKRALQYQLTPPREGTNG